MLQAIYPYEGPFPGTLKFSQDEIFLDIREENQYWRLVSKTDGTLGCVPTNFVRKFETEDQNFVQQYAIKALENLTSCSSKELHGKEDLLKRLLQIAKEKPSEGKIPCEEFSELKLSSPEKEVSVTGTVGLTPEKLPKQSTSLPKNFESCLVDTIRLGTNCSYADCRSVYCAIIDLLSTIPELKQNFMDYNSASDTVKAEPDYLRSPDWYLLKIKLRYFESRQNNDQECNWGLHEDRCDIVERLDELNTLLEKADPKLVSCYISSVKFQPLLSLIGLYQRETNNEIRSKLLRSIGIFCSLDSACIKICLQSVLPNELVRELRASSHREIPKIALRLRFLSILISQSQSLPVDLHGSLDQKLFSHLIELCDTTKQQSNSVDLENHAATDIILIANGLDPFEQINGEDYLFPYSVALFLLACNWHFHSVYKLSSSESSPNAPDNKTPLLKALLAKPVSSRSFLEIIIQTFNRQLDPIRVVTFLPENKDYDSANSLTQWTSFARFDVTWTDSSEKNLEDFLKKFEANSYSRKNTDNDLEYIQSLWVHNVGQTTESNSKLVLPNHASSNTPNNSVIKFLCDLFSYSDTGALIYQNDLDVIIEVINRRLQDEEPNSEHLPHLFLLLNMICINGNITNKGSLKIHNTMELLSSISQSSSFNARCKLLATAAYNHLNSILS
ncbi:unnamed protein product [Schistosoma turkestanicum]|nr:unnamed protein product [Schistosoma turkestanicum]